MIPRATARLQIHSGFTLAQAMQQLPYYADLGISHLYLSPVTRARQGSSHGYDVIDHSQIDPQIGGYAAFSALAQCARGHHMGLILDIVPNHMAAHPENPWWHDILQHGPESRFASWFDIQWRAPAHPELWGKVLLPLLPDAYGVALERGDIRLVHDTILSCYMIEVHGLRLPVAAGSCMGQHDDAVQAVLDAHDPAVPDGRLALHALLQRQHYRLAWWQCAADQINWRRFFEISDLAGLRVERDDVFDAVHALVFRLFEEGFIDGVRVDHIDGLAQPLEYCRRLYDELSARMTQRPAGQRQGKPWLVIEKILATDEALDGRWAVDGSTGYDFMDAVSAVMHDAAGETQLTEYWNRTADDARPVGAWKREARALMVRRHFAAERDALLDDICLRSQMSLMARDQSRQTLLRALEQLLIHFPVYRIYGIVENLSDTDLHYLNVAHNDARRYLLERRDINAARSLDDVVGWMKGGTDDICSIAGADSTVNDARKEIQGRILRRFQQLTPPLAAKALEDTVFYRYGRLMSRNDVGSDPGVFSMSVAAFHDWNTNRGMASPHTMLATATHDHKRGEDVRARLAVISECPAQWHALSTQCLSVMDAFIPMEPGIQATQAYMLLQMIVGAWPLNLDVHDRSAMSGFIQRIQQWQGKALREAKQMTSWFHPDLTYEDEQLDLTDVLLADPDGPGCQALAAFVQDIAPAAALNGLGTVVLRCMAPGIPDLYQGTEYWDFSLVDPDNRSKVDYASRAALLGELDKNSKGLVDLLLRWQDGALKQAVVARCLRLRRQYPDMFMHGRYEALPARGLRAGHVIAFLRYDTQTRAIVVVSRLGYHAISDQTGAEDLVPLIPGDFWQDTFIQLPDDGVKHDWYDRLSDQSHHQVGNTLPVAALLARLPVAVLCAR